MLITPTQRQDLDAAAAKKIPMFLSADGMDIGFQTEIVQVRDSHLVIENCVPPELIRSISTGKRFFMQINMMRYMSDKIDTDGKHILFPFNDMTAIEETRILERISFTADEKVLCQFVNPYDHKTLLRKPVIDLSANGVAIKGQMDSRLFSRGLVFDGIEIQVDENRFATTSGEVVYIRSIMDIRGGQFLQIGIKFHENIVSPQVLLQQAKKAPAKGSPQ